MKLPKSWITVTPLSKTLALVLFIALPFLSFYWGYNFNNQSSPVMVNENKQVDNTPEKTAQNFYDWYLNCLDNHFKNPAGKSPAQSCPYKSSPYVSGKLSSNLGGKKGGDPILCAQNTPVSFKVDKALIKDKKTTVLVHTYYASSGDNPLLVTMESDGQNWLISNIECAK